MSTFAHELQSLINRHSVENGSDTPDFILADYMGQCLSAWNYAVRRRDAWKSGVLKPQSGQLVSRPPDPCPYSTHPTAEQLEMEAKEYRPSTPLVGDITPSGGGEKEPTDGKSRQNRT